MMKGVESAAPPRGFVQEIQPRITRIARIKTTACLYPCNPCNPWLDFGLDGQSPRGSEKSLSEHNDIIPFKTRHFSQSALSTRERRLGKIASQQLTKLARDGGIHSGACLPSHPLCSSVSIGEPR